MPSWSHDDLLRVHSMRPRCAETEVRPTSLEFPAFESCHVLPAQQHTYDERKLHQVMSMTEWWILAQSDWLIANGMSTFASSAADVGLGIYGAMERFGWLNGYTIGPSSYRRLSWRLRRDWDNDPCKTIPASDPAYYFSCPNTG